jgi:hypothetical protein
MTTNRILTTLVQLGIGIPALIMLRLMWADLKEDVRELTKDLR